MIILLCWYKYDISKLCREKTHMKAISNQEFLIYAKY